MKKVPQLSKPQWLNYTVEGQAYAKAEHDAWLAMYYATYGWHKTWAGGVNSYPSEPIPFAKLVERAWENAQWLDAYDRKSGAYRDGPRDPSQMLESAKAAYAMWEAQKTYGQYVKEYHASGKTYLPEPADSFAFKWFVDATKIAEDDTFFTLEWRGEEYTVPRANVV